jgi:hypothetical protein
MTNVQRMSVPLTSALQDFGVTLSQRDLAYKAFVVCQDQKILVEAWLPEQVAMDVHADYDAPYAKGIQDAVNPKLGEFTRFIGMSLTTQALTAQIWQGGSFVDITLQFIFQSESGAAADVMKPIQDLLRLMMPADPSNGGFLQAPGPHVDLNSLAANGKEAASQISSSIASALSAIASSPVQTMKDMVTNPLGVAQNVQAQANKDLVPASQALMASVKNNISLYVGQFLYFPSVVIKDVSPTFDVTMGTDKNPIRASVNVTFSTFVMPTQNDIDTMFPAATVKTQTTR